MNEPVNMWALYHIQTIINKNTVKQKKKKKTAFAVIYAQHIKHCINTNTLVIIRFGALRDSDNHCVLWVCAGM